MPPHTGNKCFERSPDPIDKNLENPRNSRSRSSLCFRWITNDGRKHLDLQWLERKRTGSQNINRPGGADDNPSAGGIRRDQDQVLRAGVKLRVTNCDAWPEHCVLTICGGSAYRENSRVSQMLRDARAGHVMSPTTDMLKTWAGRALLGLPLL